MNELLDITVDIQSDDMSLFTAIVNEGIDARLEGFTESRFYPGKGSNRFCLDFAPNEIQILLRRLLAIETEESDRWVVDIVECYYGYETI